MIGIYKITNQLNGHMYIGQSIDIEERWNEHIRESSLNDEKWKKNKRGEQTHLYRAIRKYGKDNFIFEIIEECQEEELNSKEIFWIAHYNTFLDPQHYNMTAGGDGMRGRAGEKSPGHKISLEEANFIKAKLKERWTAKQIREYIPTASDGIISSINTGKSWFDENESYPLGIDNGHRKWSNEEAMEIKKKYAMGTTIMDLAREYGANYNTISHLLSGKSYTNLPVIPREVDWHRVNNKRKFTEEQVREYRQAVAEGRSILDVYANINTVPCNYAAFYNMITKRTYKNIE